MGYFTITPVFAEHGSLGLVLVPMDKQVNSTLLSKNGNKKLQFR